MKSFIPYQISHIYLDKSLSRPVMNVDQEGNYLVFWWKEIPLGDLFIEASELLGEDQYVQKLILSIKSTVHFYSQNAENPIPLWEDWILNKEDNNWNQWMNTILITKTPDKIPTKVPVSIVICTKNRSTYLKQCLHMLKGLRCLPEEIVVIDNAPVDTSTKEVVAAFEGVSYIQELRAGLDIARNSGIKHTNCPVIAFTDDDVLVHPLWIYYIWQTFQDISIAAMTGLVIASRLDTEAQQLFEKRWSFNRGYTDKLYKPEFLKLTFLIGPPVWEIGAGANMAFRKSIFEKTGNFNDLLDMGAAGCSGDSELWFRILLAGFSIAYNPRAVVYHEHRRDINGLKKQIFSYMRGHTVAALVQYKQYPGSGYRNRIFKQLPMHYKYLLIRDFPHYKDQELTIWAEMKGILSGLIYYYRHKRSLFRPSR